MNLKVNICGVELENPVIAASGTFGFGREYAELYDLSEIGAISVKGLTKAPRAGNPPPRITETYGGILNSVGLQTPVWMLLLKKKFPFCVNIVARLLQTWQAVPLRIIAKWLKSSRMLTLICWR